ncbi:MAG: anti-sigma factor ChrR (cupin superfamily) [Pseudohongiellaceae bacterium]|jgi:anti-sigma factor ChrR (cupin superfamily)
MVLQGAPLLNARPWQMLGAMKPSQYVDSGELPWRPSPHSGVRWKKLRYDDETGASVVLLHFAPGASYGAHMHPAGEQYFVLAGALQDGQSTWSQGAFVHHAPGSAHRPASKEGCLLLVTLPAPIEPLEPHDATTTAL